MMVTTADLKAKLDRLYGEEQYIMNSQYLSDDERRKELIRIDKTIIQISRLHMDSLIQDLTNLIKGA